MSWDTRMAAFVEMVLRPLSEDWRLILEKIQEIKLPITERLIRDTAIAMGLWHLCGEVIRAVSYVAVTWIICQTIRTVWPLL